MEQGIILAPEVIGHLGILPITNTLIVSWIVVVVLSLFSILATRKIALIPNRLQNFLEIVIDGGYVIVEDLAESKARMFFPFVMTFFLYIVVANWLGLLPGFNTVGFFETHEGHTSLVPLFRSINSDLNMTLSLALISVIATHVLSVKYLGIKAYLSRWVSLNPIFLFVGVLEIISEFTKVISLSFRLFGNIFAGEVVLATVSGIFAFLAPLPFYFMEIIVGFVQAAVFMMLTLVFLVILTEKHAEH